MHFLIFKYKYNFYFVYILFNHVILLFRKVKLIIMTNKKSNNSMNNMDSIWSENDLKELSDFVSNLDKIELPPIDFSSLEPPNFNDLEDVNISDLIKELKKR